ncbi:MAG: hypothetical protein IIY21_00605 [Clostridiales bacterium]|nr:hypothetical protein [Clostridiales bacterium]
MWLSIMGMYEYDNSLFDGLDVPTYTDDSGTVHVVNKQDVINSILLNCAELEVIYTNFDTMKLAIGVWSASEQDTWKKMFESQKLKYNPLWNVDADIVNIGSVMGFNEDENWSDAAKETQRRTGNIGVTSSQSLVREYRDVADFSIIRFITESFKKRFCLMVY